MKSHISTPYHVSDILSICIVHRYRTVIWNQHMRPVRNVLGQIVVSWSRITSCRQGENAGFKKGTGACEGSICSEQGCQQDQADGAEALSTESVNEFKVIRSQAWWPKALGAIFFDLCKEGDYRNTYVACTNCMLEIMILILFSSE